MQRLRITIEIDTDMTREQFNHYVNATGRVFANGLGELVYLATEMSEQTNIMHDTTENEISMSQRLR